MKAELAQQRWSSISCPLSIIGSRELKTMQKKRRREQGREVVQS
jgi:hypothetical protein